MQIVFPTGFYTTIITFTNRINDTVWRGTASNNNIVLIFQKTQKQLCSRNIELPGTGVW